ncbi:hypothetical protein MF410_27270 (plasmid) [Rhizobium sp. C104]|nr:hypothetical protein MF410_27270 [Rhizobium sp. C104]
MCKQSSSDNGLGVIQFIPVDEGHRQPDACGPSRRRLIFVGTGFKEKGPAYLKSMLV